MEIIDNRIEEAFGIIYDDAISRPDKAPFAHSFFRGTHAPLMDILI